MTDPKTNDPRSRPAETERKPGAQERAYWKRIERRGRNICNLEREQEGRIRQELRAELHDLTRPGGGK